MDVCHICGELAGEFEKLLHALPKDYSQSHLEPIAKLGAIIAAHHHIHAKDNWKLEPSPLVTNIPSVKSSSDSVEGNEVEEELHDAEKYLGLYWETKDKSYKDMAREELKHADFWLRKERMTKLDPLSQSEIQHHIVKYNDLLNQVNSSNPY